jgi:hypothetical protein
LILGAEFDRNRLSGENDHTDWRAFGVLPAFDLQLWGRLHDVQFSDSLVANAIWPDAECDNVE